MKAWETAGGCRITRLLFGRCNVFLLENGGSRLLVDTGWKGDRGRLMKRIGQAGRPDAVIMTHTHFDHAGNAAAIRDLYSPVFLVHDSEGDFLESGDSPLPGGTNGFTQHLSRLGREKVQHLFRVDGVKPGIVFGDRFELRDFGFSAYILHTPGHSRGSCSIVLDDGIALVGDTMVGFGALIYPPWADDADELLRSWKKLLETGCEIFLPAHGMSISRKILQKAFVKHTR